jgi:capsular polysaccharide transport system permease protein
LRQVSPSNPQIPSLTSRAQLLREAIGRQEARVAGRQPASFTTQSSGYDRLVLEKTFAERQLASSLAALENAATRRSGSSSISRRWCSRTCRTRRSSRGGADDAMVFCSGLIVWGRAELGGIERPGAHGVKTGAVPGRETSFMNSLAIQLG